MTGILLVMAGAGALLCSVAVLILVIVASVADRSGLDGGDAE